MKKNISIKKILMFMMLIFSTSIVHAFKNYIINNSGEDLNIRIRYGSENSGNGTGVFLPLNSDLKSEYFKFFKNQIIEFDINTKTNSYLDTFSPIKIRSNKEPNGLAMDIDLEKISPCQLTKINEN